MVEPSTPKTPQRSPDAIVKDITTEREALQKSFDTLGADLSEAADAARQKADERKAQAKRAAPYAGGAILAAILGGVLLRRRRRS
jgi:hypothetical protein